MHLFLRHTIRNETHITRIDINLCRFAQHINLVESIHDILRDYLARATDTMTVEVDAELLMVKMYELLYC